VRNREARRNFERVLAGKAPRRHLSPAEAKARLRAADPGIDISGPLASLNRGEVEDAATALAVETAVAISLPSLRSLLRRAVVHLLADGRRQDPG